MTADKDFGINGWISKITLIKSRMNRAGQEFGMVYDQQSGFNRELSMFQMLVENDLVNTGTWSYLKGLDTKKFQKKSFLEKFNNDEDVRRHMKMLVSDLGNSLLSNCNVADISKIPMEKEEIENEFFASIIDDYKSSAIYM